MKKMMFLAAVLMAMTHTAFAEQQGVFMEIHSKSIPGKNLSVNRAPMQLPIEVVYNTDTRKIEIMGPESLEAEVYLYNANGTIEDYASTLNIDFTVLNPGTYTIQIQTDGWYAEGKIEVQ